MASPVYKILTEAAFREAERKGHFAGSAVLRSAPLGFGEHRVHRLPEGVAA